MAAVGAPVADCELLDGQGIAHGWLAHATSMNPRDLIGHAENYLLSRETTPVYARQIRNRSAELARFAGEHPITAAVLNRFLIALAEGRRPSTVRGYRTSVLSVLRFAGWQPETPVRSIRVLTEPIECFRADEILAQIKTAGKMKGELPNGMTNADFWALAIHAGYGIGVRQADLLSIKKSEIAADGTAILQPSKTRRFNKTLTVRFPPAAMILIRRHAHEYAVPWPHSQEHFRQEFKALLIASGVRRGCWKWLRRSAGTFAELQRAGNGHKLLGNSPRIFQRHYDASQMIDPRPITPPPLRPPWWRRLFRPA